GPVPARAARLARQAGDFRACLSGQLERYRHGLAMGAAEREALDQHLEELGRSCLGDALLGVLDAGPRTNETLLWVPDGALHGLPIHALRRGGRYLVETHP